MDHILKLVTGLASLFGAIVIFIEWLQYKEWKERHERVKEYVDEPEGTEPTKEVCVAFFKAVTRSHMDFGRVQKQLIALYTIMFLQSFVLFASFMLHG